MSKRMRMNVNDAPFLTRLSTAFENGYRDEGPVVRWTFAIAYLSLLGTSIGIAIFIAWRVFTFIF